MGLSYLADWAWTGERFEADVVLDVEDGVLTRVAAGEAAPTGAVHLVGATLPGLANAHSHAFHRALRGRTHDGAGDFWTWRERMYAVAACLDPDSYERLATACFAEMALAGITVVGEFHYLHHGPGGAPYDDPNAMAEALRSAAAAAGIRLTLLDTLYLTAGFAGEPLDQAQERFSDGDVERWAARVEALHGGWRNDDRARVGVGVHSVRAVDPASMKAAAAFSSSGRLPLHVHLSEQPAENDACQDAHGCSPAELLAANGVLGPFTTAVHATHVTAADLDLLAAEGCAVCLCPTTERDLADGVGPAWAMAEQGIPLAVGSDSQAVIDLFEEVRAIELDERLVHRERGGLSAEALLAAATEDGAEALGWPEAGRLAEGRLADLTTIGLDSVRLAGSARDASALAAAVVFSATPADVARGRRRRRAGGAERASSPRRRRARTARAQHRRARGVVDVAAQLITNIGRLFTSTSDGVHTDVDVLVDDGRIAWIGRSGGRPPIEPEESVDVEDALVTPGLIDAHSHPVYAGDRMAEIAMRSAGASYTDIVAAGGGIRSTVEATREASREELAWLVDARLASWLAQGTTTVEAKTGYHLERDGELMAVRLLADMARSSRLPRVEVTFLGAHDVGPEYAGRADDYIEQVAAWCPDAAAAGARFVDVFCDAGYFSSDQARRVLDAGVAAGLRARVHADELARSGGSELAAEVGAVSADHLLVRRGGRGQSAGRGRGGGDAVPGDRAGHAPGPPGPAAARPWNHPCPRQRSQPRAVGHDEHEPHRRAGRPRARALGGRGVGRGHRRRRRGRRRTGPWHRRRRPGRRPGRVGRRTRGRVRLAARPDAAVGVEGWPGFGERAKRAHLRARERQRPAR